MDSEMIDLRVAVSVMEAARLLGIGRTKVYELLKSGELRSRKVGRRTVVSVASIRAFISDAEAEAPAGSPAGGERP